MILLFSMVQALALYTRCTPEQLILYRLLSEESELLSDESAGRDVD
jgi:hypothetical protein